MAGAALPGSEEPFAQQQDARLQVRRGADGCPLQLSSPDAVMPSVDLVSDLAAACGNLILLERIVTVCA